MFSNGGIAKETGSVFEYLIYRVRFPESVASFGVKPMLNGGFYNCLTFFEPG